ncbi:hypothetical protein DFH06DRAFT_1337810 [Mycena polygramma]|nr:hypothetical protein DFH06DRAFT_1337810 [Mycena polygramma]
MDVFYNTDSAAATLETISAERRETLKKRNDGRVMHLGDVDENRIAISEAFQGRRSWRMCTKENDEEVKDEVVMRLQGILTKNNLVPKNVASCPRAKAQFLSQHAEICGLGTDTFKDAMEKVGTINDLFAQQLAGVEIIPMGDRVGDTADAFASSNRIFTSKVDVPTEQDNDFQPGVDPMKLLEKMKSGELIHAPDNIVTYFKRTKADGNQAFTYEEFIPGGFKIGDIVEMQVCFVAMASARNAVKVTARLQALTLLDDQFSKTAATARREASSVRPATTALRRKVGYFREDDEDERQVKKSKSSSPGAEGGR